MILIKFGIAVRMNKLYVMLQKLYFCQNTLWTTATGTEACMKSYRMKLLENPSLVRNQIVGHLRVLKICPVYILMPIRTLR
jgi:hypothetical protein